MANTVKKRVKVPSSVPKRRQRMVCLMSEEEVRIVDAYLKKYKISNKARWLRETVLAFIHEKMEEDYPTLSEVLKSGWEGAKGGMFMGAFLGGANRAVGHHFNRKRRQEQGYVDLAETKDGNVVEILGQKVKEFEDGTTEYSYSVLMPDGSLNEDMPSSDIVEKARITTEEFENGIKAKAEADVEDSYEAGRALGDEESDEGMIDAKNVLGKASEDLARNMGCHAEELEETLLANGVYDSLEDRLARLNPDHWGDEHVELFTKYMNARAQYEGMVERVQDDIDEKVASSHAFIDENVDQEGNITPAYLVDDERSVYVVNQSADGSSVVVRDAETGETKMVSAEQVRLTGETMSAEAVKAETEAAIREEESTKAASRIDGTVQLAPGNVYPVLIGDDETGEDSGQSSTLTIMQDNGDGTAVVMLGDNAEQQLTLSVDVIQGIVDAYHKTRLAQRLAEEKDAVEAEISSQPTEQVIANDMVDGVSSTREQQPIVDGQEENNVPADEVDETALSRIPVDENGEQLFEKAPISDSWAALVEMNEGDTAEAKDTAEQMVQQAQKALEKEQKKKSAGGSTIMEIQKAKAAHKAALRDLQKRVDYWTNVANFLKDKK